MSLIMAAKRAFPAADRPVERAEDAKGAGRRDGAARDGAEGRAYGWNRGLRRGRSGSDSASGAGGATDAELCAGLSTVLLLARTFDGDVAAPGTDSAVASGSGDLTSKRQMGHVQWA